MQPQILVLKEGTENAQGKQQCISNINACQAIVDAIRTTLGPRGMDKLIVDNRGKATISNDGATIMKVSWLPCLQLLKNPISYTSLVKSCFFRDCSEFQNLKLISTWR